MAIFTGDILLLYELVRLTQFEWHVLQREFGGGYIVFVELLLDLNVDVFAVGYVFLDGVLYFKKFSVQPAQTVEHAHFVVLKSALHKSPFESVAL